MAMRNEFAIAHLINIQTNLDALTNKLYVKVSFGPVVIAEFDMAVESLQIITDPSAIKLGGKFWDDLEERMLIKANKRLAVINLEKNSG